MHNERYLYTRMENVAVVVVVVTDALCAVQLCLWESQSVNDKPQNWAFRKPMVMYM